VSGTTPGPTFIIIGAMKAGTTSLHRYLAAHPDIFMTRHKEPDFFIEEKSWPRGLDWYRSLFAEGAGATVRGESSTSYSKAPAFDGVAERMRHAFPDLKLIYLLRDPLLRAASHVLHNHHGRTRSPPSELLTSAHVLACSDYAGQLSRYLRHFDPGQILVAFSDDLLHDRQATYCRILDFLGVEPSLPSGIVLTHGTTGEDPRLVLRAADEKTRTSVGRSLLKALNALPGAICSCRSAAVQDWIGGWTANLKRWAAGDLVETESGSRLPRRWQGLGGDAST
jgi:hypothetical protein